MRDLVKAFVMRPWWLLMLDVFLFALALLLLSDLWAMVGGRPAGALPGRFETIPASVLQAVADKPAPVCLTEQDMRRQIARDEPAAAITVVTDRAAYMALFNALPPATAKPVPATLLLVEAPHLPTVLVLAFGGHGCLSFYSTVIKAQHERLLERLGESI